MLRHSIKRFFSSSSPDVSSKVSLDSIVNPLGKSRMQKAKKLRRELKKVTDAQGSLISQTLEEMEKDESMQLTLKRLKELSQEGLTREEKIKRRRALSGLGIKGFSSFLRSRELPQLTRVPTEVFQINIGLYCNQACTHCHVESSPKRIKEQMDRKTVDKCLELIAASPTVKMVDITGGAPELNENFFYLAEEAAKLGKTVIDRCNLTVLSEPGMEHLPQFLADKGIQVVASLPCYSEENVNQQRGNNVFQRSILGLLTLNKYGYGIEGSGLKLDLVYNPVGPSLPPDQAALELDYKRELRENFGIEFSNLLTITNMPIKRFADMLFRRGELREYMHLLVDNFNPSACESAMCRNYLSVDYNGNIYDCDFNQQLAMRLLGIPEGESKKRALNVFDLKTTQDIIDLPILTGNHCFGCVSGAGSSCQGATA
eukprot:augustus_masked-scaffold_11-processed-gene-6.57-mRNA-1 protein AED:0.01 eAED:0.01 QI:0/-1/0/1/-1/1/1/0/428